MILVLHPSLLSAMYDSDDIDVFGILGLFSLSRLQNVSVVTALT
jgi:hypothetical protein